MKNLRKEFEKESDIDINDVVYDNGEIVIKYIEWLEKKLSQPQPNCEGYYKALSDILTIGNNTEELGSTYSDDMARDCDQALTEIVDIAEKLVALPQPPTETEKEANKLIIGDVSNNEVAVCQCTNSEIIQSKSGIWWCPDCGLYPVLMAN